jgi:hypothetical protein
MNLRNFSSVKDPSGFVPLGETGLKARRRDRLIRKTPVTLRHAVNQVL